MGWAGNDKYTPAQSSHSTINQRKHSNVASMCLLANGSATDKFTPLRQHYRQRQWLNWTWRDGKGFGKAGRGR